MTKTYLIKVLTLKKGNFNDMFFNVPAKLWDDALEEKKNDKTHDLWVLSYQMGWTKKLYKLYGYIESLLEPGVKIGLELERVWPKGLNDQN